MCIFPGGGGGLSPKSYVDVPAGPRKSDYLYTNFLPNVPPISIPFSKEKHPIWIKLGAFYNNLPKIHPIYVIWAPSSLMKTPRSLYQISRKGAPKGRHIYVYHVNVRTPPGYFLAIFVKWDPLLRMFSTTFDPCVRVYAGGTHLGNEIVMLECLQFLCFDVQCKSEVTIQTWNLYN